jgi:anti-sigma factor RsiW
MSLHSDIRGSLYEFVMGELSPREQGAVRRHLDSCPACAADEARMRRAVSLVKRPSDNPDTERPPEFWDSFASGVEAKIALRAPGRSRRLTWLIALPGRVRDALASLFVMRGGQVAAAGLSVAMAVLALVLLTRPGPESGRTSAVQGPGHTAEEASHEGSSPATGLLQAAADSGTAATVETNRVPAASAATGRGVQYASDRVTQYFRRSKILLVGIANMQEDQDHQLDLSAERRTSKALVKEARFLRQQNDIDPRTRGLIEALNRILIELANLAESNQAPGVEIIRGGIRQENLLFKIRMAEAARDTTHYKGMQGL